MRRYAILAFLVVPLWAQIASDSFGRADGVLGTNWTAAYQTFEAQAIYQAIHDLALWLTPHVGKWPNWCMSGW